MMPPRCKSKPSGRISLRARCFSACSCPWRSAAGWGSGGSSQTPKGRRSERRLRGRRLCPVRAAARLHVFRSGSRFDARRQLIVQEANTIGTAYLRLELLPAEAQPALRGLFREYLDSRLEAYRKLPDVRASLAELGHSVEIQGRLWTQAVAACRAQNNPATTSLVLGSLNELIDILTTRMSATRIHPPEVIFWLLFALGLGCALMAGYGMAGSRTRSWVHMIGFAAITALTVYVILDMEFPRFGLVRVDAMDQVLVDLRQSMK